jgi:hypothetical protein
MSYVKEAAMKARKNPTIEQVARRLRSSPLSCHDPRIKNDAYWALRAQGYPHSYAIRAFRDQLPMIHQRKASADLGEYACDPGELLLPPESTWAEIEVAVRPELSEESIRNLKPRTSEYTAWDNHVPGFGVRVRVSGHRSYVVYYRPRPEKRLRKRTIGLIGELSLDEARRIAQSYRREARMSRDLIEHLNA